jgi:hypothetical protein
MTREEEMKYTEDMAQAQVKALSSSGDGDNNKTKWSEQSSCIEFSFVDLKL